MLAMKSRTDATGSSRLRGVPFQAGVLRASSRSFSAASSPCSATKSDTSYPSCPPRSMILVGTPTSRVVVAIDSACFPSRLVAVRHDQRPCGADEMARVLLTPTVRAHRVTGCGEAERGKRVRVLLALDDPDRPPRLCRFGYIREPVRHAANVFQAPRPAAVSVRSALAEVFRTEAHNLEEQPAILVLVVVRLGDIRS